MHFNLQVQLLPVAVTRLHVEDLHDVGGGVGYMSNGDPSNVIRVGVVFLKKGRCVLKTVEFPCQIFGTIQQQR